MNTLTDTPAMVAAANGHPDPQLRHLLQARLDQLSDYDGYEPSDIAQFLVVEPGDTLPAIAAALGFSPLAGVDGNSFPDPAFLPAFETCDLSGGWYELTFVLGQDGSGAVVFVPDQPGVPSDLLALCRAFAGDPGG